MKSVYEVIMRRRVIEDTKFSRITYRSVGMRRDDAVKKAQELAGSEYEVYYVVAGPRMDE